MSLPPTFVKGFHYENFKMDYQQLGKTHMYVSKISIGAATLCDNFYGKLDFDEAKRTIIEALKRGINYVDTAPFYGQGESEKNLGKILKDVPRQAFYIATKTGRYNKSGDGQFDFSYDRTIKSVDESLEKLGVSYIDLYQLHDVEFADSIDEVINGAFKACLELKKQGKIKAIGINGYPLSVLKEGLIKGEGKFDTVLSYARYTLTDDSLLEYLPFFEEKGLGVICAAVNGCGMLTNREPPVWHPADARLKAIVKEAAEICKKNDIQLGKLAVHHSMSLKSGKVATFLMGMEKMDYLNYNMSAYLDGLSAKEMEVYEMLMKEVFSKVLPEFKHWEGFEVARYREERKKF